MTFTLEERRDIARIVQNQLRAYNLKRKQDEVIAAMSKIAMQNAPPKANKMEWEEEKSKVMNQLQQDLDDVVEKIKSMEEN